MSDSSDGFDLPFGGGRLLRLFLETDSGSRENPVNPLYVIGGLLAMGLLIYLLVALLKPEIFS